MQWNFFFANIFSSFFDLLLSKLFLNLFISFFCCFIDTIYVYAYTIYIYPYLYHIYAYTLSSIILLISLMRSSSHTSHILITYTAWKLSVFGVILVRIFPHFDWIRRDSQYLSVLSPNAGKCWPDNSEYGHFLRSAILIIISSTWTNKKIVWELKSLLELAQLTFTCLKLIRQTLEKGVKYVQS